MVDATESALAALPAQVRRVAYLGNPSVAVPPLEALVADGFEVAAVVTGADRRRGRGSTVSPTPVKQAAVALGLEVHHDLGVLDEIDVDLGVVVAFGSILPTAVLQRCPMVNLHFSLLPRWRGAAPVERAILAGDPTTGVCVMQVVPALDAGGVLACVEVPLAPDSTLQSVWDDLARLGGSLLVDTLSGTLPEPKPQEGEITYAHKLGAEDVRLDWALPAEVLERRVRVGGAWTTVRNKRLRVIAATACDASPDDPRHGELRGHVVGTGSGTLQLDEVIAEGRARQAGLDWSRGARLEPGERLGAGS
jgi:methionyl-tRNA formyltransferase